MTNSLVLHTMAVDTDWSMELEDLCALYHFAQYDALITRSMCPYFAIFVIVAMAAFVAFISRLSRSAFQVFSVGVLYWLFFLAVLQIVTYFFFIAVFSFSVVSVHLMQCLLHCIFSCHCLWGFLPMPCPFCSILFIFILWCWLFGYVVDPKLFFNLTPLTLMVAIVSFFYLLFSFWVLLCIYYSFLQCFFCIPFSSFSNVEFCSVSPEMPQRSYPELGTCNNRWSQVIKCESDRSCRLYLYMAQR